MSPYLLYTLLALAVIAASFFYLFYYRDWYRDWRRSRELEKPFPEAWRTLLQAQVPAYRQLAPGLQRKLEQLVQLFLAEKNFYGCDGFEVDDRVRLTIAGHACRLLLGRSFSDFDDVRSILVYPDIFRVQHAWEHGLVVHEGEEIRAGEASSHGQVVLAWSECEAATDPHSPHNVILHEFAHQLDYLDGSADGAPPLPGPQAEDWYRIMSNAWENLQQTLEHHHRPWLDPYGATEPAEFFAVLTEAFFQTPDHLHQAQPQVYNALRAYYRFDPMTVSIKS